ncbi:MAG: PaaI family thioesterase [Salinigranum sp.]
MPTEVDRELEEYFETMPFLDTIGITKAEIEDGTARFYVPVSDHISNHSVVHGGVAATLIDATVAAATHSAAGATLDDMEPLTISNTANYLAPIEEGEIVAEATMRSVGRTIAYGESDVYNGETLVATGSTTYFQKWK